MVVRTIVHAPSHYLDVNRQLDRRGDCVDSFGVTRIPEIKSKSERVYWIAHPDLGKGHYEANHGDEEVYRAILVGREREMVLAASRKLDLVRQKADRIALLSGI